MGPERRGDGWNRKSYRAGAAFGLCVSVSVCCYSIPARTSYRPFKLWHFCKVMKRWSVRTSSRGQFMVSKLGFKFNNEIRTSSNHQEPNVGANVEERQDSVPQTAPRKGSLHWRQWERHQLFTQNTKQLVVFLVCLLRTLKNSGGEIYWHLFYRRIRKLSKVCSQLTTVKLPVGQCEHPIQTSVLQIVKIFDTLRCWLTFFY